MSLRRREAGFVVGWVLLGLIGVSIVSGIAYQVVSTSIASQASQKALIEAVGSTKLSADALASVLEDDDSDGTLEPPAAVADGTISAATGGGGRIGAGLGAPTTDSWGQPIAYCAYDHGAEINPGGGRLAGQAAITGATIVLSTISGGPDRTIVTTCADSVASTVNGDDIVQIRSFAAAADLAAGGSGLGTSGGSGEGGGLPSGAVVAFNLPACPTGWSELTDAAGRFIVGIGTLGSDTYALSDTGGEARHILTNSEMPVHQHNAGTLSASSAGGHYHGSGSLTTNTAGGHSHQYTSFPDGVDAGSGGGYARRYNTATNNTSSAGAHSHSISGNTATAGAHSHTISGSTDDAGGNAAHENRPPYLALLYCQKD